MFLPLFIRELQASSRHRSSRRQRKTDYTEIELDPDVIPFAHSVLDEKGNRVCEKGYISGPVIDKRGCWSCIEFCDSVSECAYPGSCITKIPEIKASKMKTINNTAMTVVLYEIQDFVIEGEPEKAFCRFDNNPVKAAKVTKDKIYCARPEKFQSLAISFDQQSWSDITEQVSAETKKSKSWIPVICVIFAVGILSVVFVLLRKRNIGSIKKDNGSTNKPLAYFPTVEEGEKKVTYY